MVKRNLIIPALTKALNSKDDLRSVFVKTKEVITQKTAHSFQQVSVLSSSLKLCLHDVFREKVCYAPLYAYSQYNASKSTTDLPTNFAVITLLFLLFLKL